MVYQASFRAFKTISSTAMKQVKLLFILALLVTLSPATSSAQEVKFDMPTEINIIQGRLSVAFNDNVHEETARLLVTGMGYDIIDTVFEPRYIWANVRNRLSSNRIRQIEANPKVLSISQTALPQPVLSINDEAVERTRPRFSLAITFASTVSQEEAAAFLKESLNTTIAKSEKRPNELVIDVGDQDAEAFSMLEGRDEVKWVTYVGVPGG